MTGTGTGLQGAEGRPSAADRCKCAVLGHDVSFAAHGRTMVWGCRRGCDTGGTKVYASAEDAARYAAAFDRRPTDNLGHRAPLIGLFPLRLWHRLRNGRSVEGSGHVR